MLEATTAAPQGVGAASIRRFYLYQLVTRTEFTGGIWEYLYPPRPSTPPAP